MQRNSQVKSTGGPQSKAPAGMPMVLRPDTTSEMLKWKVIVVLPFVTTTESAVAPLILKSLAWTVDGSTGLLTFTTKSLGRVKMVITHEGLVTVQGVAVTAARASRNAMMTMIDVGVRFIFTFHITLLLQFEAQKILSGVHRKAAGIADEMGAGSFLSSGNQKTILARFCEAGR
jgi:hypothetical protein